MNKLMSKKLKMTAPALMKSLVKNEVITAPLMREIIAYAKNSKNVIKEFTESTNPDKVLNYLIVGPEDGFIYAGKTKQGNKRFTCGQYQFGRMGEYLSLHNIKNIKKELFIIFVKVSTNEEEALKVERQCIERYGTISSRCGLNVMATSEHRKLAKVQNQTKISDVTYKEGTNSFVMRVKFIGQPEKTMHFNNIEEAASITGLPKEKVQKVYNKGRKIEY